MIAIIGILVALLLPAVQVAREAGRRISCTNNLKQLGIALQNYESARKKLPAAGTYDESSLVLKTPSGYTHHWRIDLQSGTGYSWVVELLPYMEETSLAAQFDLSVSEMESGGQALQEQPASFLCPSESARGRYYQWPEASGTGAVRFGKGNYAAFVNPFHIDSWFYSGAISLFGLRMGQISDATSQTLVFSEVRTRDNEGDVRGAWALPWSGATLLAPDVHPAFPGRVGSCQPYQCQLVSGLRQGSDKQSLPPYTPWRGSIGYSQRPNTPLPDILYECPDPEGAQVERLPCEEFALARYMSAAPRSNHIGGVNATFLDGHVSFLSDDVDEMVLAAMVAINDVKPPGEYQ